MADKYIGSTIGNFQVLKLCKEKTSDGHKLYDVRCIKCGQTLHHQRIAELTRKNNMDECFHCQSLAEWPTQRMRKIFDGMLRRCYAPSSKSYEFYGGKGIHVCEEWLQTPQNFIDWSMANGYTDDLTIDRVDENKDYSPSNCRWVTTEENSKWKSTTNTITAKGITDSGKGWARRLGTGTNYVNRFLRKNGYDATVKMIETRIA